MYTVSVIISSEETLRELFDENGPPVRQTIAGKIETTLMFWRLGLLGDRRRRDTKAKLKKLLTTPI